MKEDEDDNQSTVSLLSRSIAGKSMSALKSFAVLPLLPPEDYGLYRLVYTLVGYLNHLHLGTFNLLGFHVPRFEGGASSERAATTNRVTWQLTVLGGLLSGLLIATFLTLRSSIPLIYCISVPILAAFNLPATYSITLLRSRAQFSRTATAGIIDDVVSFLGALAGVFVQGVGGLLTGSMLGKASVVGLCRDMHPPPGWRNVSVADWASVLKQSVHLWSAGFLASMSMTLDLAVLANLLGTESAILGFYGLGIVLGTNTEALIAPLGQVETVRMSESAGASETITDDLLQQAQRALFRDVFIASVLCGLVGMAAGTGIQLLLPKYREATTVIGPLLLAGAFRRWRRYPLHYLGMYGRLRSVHAISVTTIALLVGAFWAIHHNFPEQAWLYAVSSCTTTALSSVGLLLSLYFVAKRVMKGVRTIMRLILAIGPSIVLATPLTFGMESTWALAIRSSVCVLGVAGSFYLFAPNAVTDARTVASAFWNRIVKRR